MGFMGSPGWPDFNQFLNESWGWPDEFVSPFGTVIAPRYGKNPPYTLDDFLLVYPQFFGLATPVSGAATSEGSSSITVPSVLGLAVGQFLQGPNLPPGTVITAVGNNSITVRTQATASGTNLTLQVYEAQPVPAAVIWMYTSLALSSLNIGIWNRSWWVGMSLFIAHYCTLYAKSTAPQLREALVTVIHQEVPNGAIPGTTYTISKTPPGGVLAGLYKNGDFLRPGGLDYTLNGTTITLNVATVTNDELLATWAIRVPQLTMTAASTAQIAAQGLAWGIQTSKAVGDVSASYKPLESLTDFGAWNLTIFGQQLATMAKIIGMGPILVW